LLVEQLAGNPALIGRPFRRQDEGRITIDTFSKDGRARKRLQKLKVSLKRGEAPTQPSRICRKREPNNFLAARKARARQGRALIWLEPHVVNKLRHLRGPGESYSDVILKLAV
jgi:hypothetical protein